MSGFADNVIATGYRDEMRRQHERHGMLVIDWGTTGWTARVDGDEVVVQHERDEWRFPLVAPHYALAVMCPTCGKMPGESCVSVHSGMGLKGGRSHPLRFRAARRAG